MLKYIVKSEVCLNYSVMLQKEATDKLKANINRVIKVIQRVSKITNASRILQTTLILKQAYLTFY